MNPTPEEKCMISLFEIHECLYGYGIEDDTRDDIAQAIYKKLNNPSPEARVDWKYEAEECLKVSHDYEIVPNIVKALSAAFEKGREAR
jgi:hypothetical protein